MNEINASALMYCRTYYCDYDAGFLLKPEDFSEQDGIWAKKYILSATSYCDELDGIRWVVFGNEKYLVFGIVGVLNWLCETILPDQTDIKHYTQDEYDRNIKCFIGFVCSMPEKEKGYFPSVKEEDFLKIFIEHVANDSVWKSVNLTHLRAGYQYKLEMAYNPEDAKLERREMISEPNGDRKIFENVLANISLENVEMSLCTNLYNAKMLQDDCFSYVTASESAIRRFKKKTSEIALAVSTDCQKQAGQQKEFVEQNLLAVSDNQEENTTDIRKKMIACSIFLMIIFIFLLKGCV